MSLSELEKRKKMGRMKTINEVKERRKRLSVNLRLIKDVKGIEKDIPNLQEVICNLLICPNKIINFSKMNTMMIMKSFVTKEEYAVQKAKYLGDGNWEAINKIPIKKKKGEKQ